MGTSRTVTNDGVTYYIEERGVLQDSEGATRPPADLDVHRANESLILTTAWTDKGFLYMSGGPTTCQMWFDTDPDAAMLTLISDYWDAPVLAAQQQTDGEGYAALGTDADRIAYIAGLLGLT